MVLLLFLFSDARTARGRGSPEVCLEHMRGNRCCPQDFFSTARRRPNTCYARVQPTHAPRGRWPFEKSPGWRDSRLRRAQQPRAFSPPTVFERPHCSNSRARPHVNHFESNPYVINGRVSSKLVGTGTGFCRALTTNRIGQL
jgi:hypothetical protein